jgi:hypothetical protein
MPSISARLRALAERCDGDHATLASLIAAARGRADDLLLILLTLPFLSPIPVPLLSTVLGVLIALLGIQRIRGSSCSLPARLLEARLPPRFLRLTLAGAGRFLGWLERFLRPRLEGIADRRGWQIVSGILIAISGMLLSLPLPVPMSNFFPAITVLLLAAGHLERDGRAVLAGFGAFAASVSFFAGVALLGTAGSERLWAWLTSTG